MSCSDGIFGTNRHAGPLPSSLLSREEPRAGDLNQLDLHFTEEPLGDSVLHGAAGAGPLRWTLRPDVLLSDGAIVPLGYGHHTGTIFKLPDDARPLSGPEADRV